jgi:hypothetical protein
MFKQNGLRFVFKGWIDAEDNATGHLDTGFPWFFLS